MKFFLDNIFLFSLAILSGAALVVPMFKLRGGQLSTLQATQLMNQESPLIVDVRSPEQFASAHLRDAKSIPLGELRKRVGELDSHKQSTIILVCQSGSQAPSASAFLKKAGFAKTFSLTGGMDAWQAQSLPTVK